MSDVPVFPPLDGTIPAIPGLVDFQAKHNPKHPWAVFPSGSPLSSISFEEYADATHRVATAFRPDKTTASGEVVALIIYCDSILYLAMLAGLIRAGYVPFPMSPKNSVPAFLNLLEKTNCHHIVSQPAFAPIVSALQARLAEKQFKVQIIDLPQVHDIFPSLSKATSIERVERFPLSAKPFHKEEIVLYLHSSGSTGHPKPIPQNHAVVLQWCGTSAIYETRKRGTIWASMALPTFHTIGIYMQFYAPLASSYPIGLYPPVAPALPAFPTPSSLLQAIKETNSTGIPVVPAFVEAWAQDDESIKVLANLHLVGYAGGPLSKPTGEKLVKAGVPLCTVYGQTETGVHTQLFDIDYTQGPDAPVKTADDWEWLSFPDYLNCRWVPQGDGLYELHFLRCDAHWPSIENLPDRRGYATGDLWVPHPTKKGLWKITGRKDDILTLGTEQIVPIQQEGIITGHAMVSGAVMFGRAPHGCGVLLELRPDHAINPSDGCALKEFRNKIWPTVEAANQTAPAFAHIREDMIIVTSTDKPLPRAAKGTVVRPQALKLYATEIDELFADI